MPTIRDESQRKRTLSLVTIGGRTIELEVVYQQEKSRILVFIKDPAVLLMISQQVLLWDGQRVKEAQAGLEHLEHAKRTLQSLE